MNGEISGIEVYVSVRVHDSLMDSERKTELSTGPPSCVKSATCGTYTHQIRYD